MLILILPFAILTVVVWLAWTAFCTFLGLLWGHGAIVSAITGMVWGPLAPVALWVGSLDHFAGPVVGR